MLRSSIYTLILFFACACKQNNPGNNKDKKLEEINTAFHQQIAKIDNKEKLKEKKAYLIIPNTGCSGCITEAENMLKSAVNTTSDITYILTNVESIKMLKIKLGAEVLQNQNILIDKEDYFYQGVFKSIYPTVLFVNTSGDVYKVMSVSPNEDGLNSLRKELRKS